MQAFVFIEGKHIINGAHLGRTVVFRIKPILGITQYLIILLARLWRRQYFHPLL